ncbi:hypothetical protein NPIL_249721, partial [Nephila pilipes]
ALRAFRCRRMLHRGPLSPQDVRDVISRFEETMLSVQRNRGRNLISAKVSEVAMSVIELSLTNDRVVRHV